MGTGAAGVEFVATVFFGQVVFGQLFGMVRTVADGFSEGEKVVV